METKLSIVDENLSQEANSAVRDPNLEDYCQDFNGLTEPASRIPPRSGSLPNVGNQLDRPNKVSRRREYLDTSNKSGKWTIVTHISSAIEDNPDHPVELVVVYLYNSTQCVEATVVDPDLDLFRLSQGMRMVNQRKESTHDSSLGAKHGKNPKLSLPTMASKKPASISSKQSESVHEHRRINWIHDLDMLPHEFRNLRTMTVGFDVKFAVDTPFNYKLAASELSTLLVDARLDDPKVPLLFLGHSFGALIILQLLIDTAPQSVGRPDFFDYTAGVLSFSNASLGAEKRLKLAAELLGISPKARFFSELGPESMTMEELLDKLKVKEQRRKREKKEALGANRNEVQDKANVCPPQIGFLVTNFTTSEKRDPWEPDEKLGAHRAIRLKKTFFDALKFSNPSDADFQQVVKEIRYAIEVRLALDEASKRSESKLFTMVKNWKHDNHIDRWGNTPLNVAIRMENETVIRFLLHSRLADPNLENDEGNTPLHLAVKTNNGSVVTELLRYGANMYIRNNYGRSSKDIVENSKRRRHLDDILTSHAVHGPNENYHPKRIGNNTAPATDDAITVCRHARIFVTEIYDPGTPEKLWTVAFSVMEVLYRTASLEDILAPIRPRWTTGSSRTCTWIHVPGPNLIWIEDLFTKLKLDDDDAIWQDHTWNATQAKMISNDDSDRDDPAAPSLMEKFDRGYESSGSEPSIDGGREEGDINLVEQALIRAYMHDPPALQLRRTLDQYYYHMLKDTKLRDDDQVVSRWAKKNQMSDYNLIMVDQLWLWTTALENPYEEMKAYPEKPRYVITSFSGRFSAGPRDYDDLRSMVLSARLHASRPIGSPQDLVSRVLGTFFNIWDQGEEHEKLQFLQIFETSVATIGDAESKLLKEFRNSSVELIELIEMSPDSLETKKEILGRMLDIRHDTELLIQIRDIRDEINIILSVLDIQSDMIKMILHASYEHIWFTPDLWIRGIVQKPMRKFRHLDKRSAAIQEKLEALMDVKQKAANAWEARSARELANEATKQGNTMLVFTIVTIVFLPLSFMSSFFALSIAAFPKNEKGDTSWPIGALCGYLFGISMTVSIPLIIFALNVQYFSSLWGKIGPFINKFQRSSEAVLNVPPTKYGTGENASILDKHGFYIKENERNLDVLQECDFEAETSRWANPQWVAEGSSNETTAWYRRMKPGIGNFRFRRPKLGDGTAGGEV
ncbi:hypothetical protein P154DRAFT_575199 [Amniculicola lignicola CBS 123094]|uniref:Uncharacterized protein n=1 Tax=Amniculicola lignicola CBS 123094 TaxID=1392246 RepID=A0A6A5WMS2_9PLEO|nr:hypothetical protein P154DRAFT_575199 [Amniculicola lignicola CBS 123094]